MCLFFASPKESIFFVKILKKLELKGLKTTLSKFYYGTHPQLILFIFAV